MLNDGCIESRKSLLEMLFLNNIMNNVINIQEIYIAYFNIIEIN